MPKPDNAAEPATGFTDPVIDPIRGTGPRPAARPAPGCPLRALSGARRAAGEQRAGRDDVPGDAG
ncbi:hypothetical protein [Actinomadura latina]|uniref:Uncharacterized protein n=1 Tax=Actinomadura latina TaxID=163603 RepID=A0A846ZEF9_9ACTN|nr:hypothetical protein [Actinomadura latina]NKZ09224.1 hypothetical protein [Actinomadura latina]